MEKLAFEVAFDKWEKEKFVSLFQLSGRLYLTAISLGVCIPISFRFMVIFKKVERL